MKWSGPQTCLDKTHLSQATVVVYNNIVGLEHLYLNTTSIRAILSVPLFKVLVAVVAHSCCVIEALLRHSDPVSGAAATHSLPTGPAVVDFHALHTRSVVQRVSAHPAGSHVLVALPVGRVRCGSNKSESIIVIIINGLKVRGKWKFRSCDTPTQSFFNPIITSTE